MFLWNKEGDNSPEFCQCVAGLECPGVLLYNAGQLISAYMSVLVAWDRPQGNTSLWRCSFTGTGNPSWRRHAYKIVLSLRWEFLYHWNSTIMQEGLGWLVPLKSVEAASWHPVWRQICSFSAKEMQLMHQKENSFVLTHQGAITWGILVMRRDNQRSFLRNGSS